MPLERKANRPWIHKTDRSKRWEQRTNGKFYHTPAWRRLRNYYIKLHPLCEECEKKGILIEAKVVDHIKPIRLGGEALSEDNLQSLCTTCHASKSAKEKKK
jgi:5-methylcytosine-specific restriction protein A